MANKKTNNKSKKTSTNKKKTNSAPYKNTNSTIDNKKEIKKVSKVPTGAKVAIILTSAAALACGGLLAYKILKPTPTKPKQCTLIYNYNDGTAEPQTYEETYDIGAAPTRPTWVPPREGYTFLDWYKSPDEDETELFNFEVALPKEGATAYAHWKEVPSPTEHTISPGELSHGKMSFNKTSATKGTTIVGTVASDSGYHCISVTSSDTEISYVPGDTTFTFVMPGKDVTVSATFVADPVEHSIATATLEHGGITFNTTSAVAGTTIVGTVAPDSGYHCTSVTSTDVTFTYVPGDTTFAFVMPDKDVTVSATFEADPVKYDIDIDSEITHGEVSTDLESAVAGTTITGTVNPVADYHCTVVTVTDADSGTVAVDYTAGEKFFTFVMPGKDVTVSATFVADPVEHSIATATLEHGGITFNTTSAVAGTTIVGTVAPDSGYHCTSVTSTDVTFTYVPGDTTFTFVMPDKDVTVSATFEADPTPTEKHTLTYHFQNGTLPDQSDEKIYVEEYESTEKTKRPPWTPTRGDYDFDNWVVINEESHTENPYNFDETLTEDLHLYARYTVSITAKYAYGTFTPVDNKATMDARNLASFSTKKFLPNESFEIKPVINPEKSIRFPYFAFYNNPTGQSDLPLEEESQLDFTNISSNFKVELNGAELVYDTDYNINVLSYNHPINIMFTKTGLSKLTQGANLVVTMMPTPTTDTVQLVIHRDNGTDPETVEYERGSVPTKPANPTYDGYTFENWYAGTDTTSAIFDFTGELTEDVTHVYAHWSVTINIAYNNTLVNSNPCSLTYTPASGTQQTITAGQTVNSVTFKNVSNDMRSVAFFTSGGSEVWLINPYEYDINFELLYNGEALTYGWNDDYEIGEYPIESGNLRVRLTNNTYGKIKNGGNLTINVKHGISEFQFYDEYETASLTYDGGSTHQEWTRSAVVDDFTINTDATADDATLNLRFLKVVKRRILS